MLINEGAYNWMYPESPPGYVDVSLVKDHNTRLDKGMAILLIIEFLLQPEYKCL